MRTRAVIGIVLALGAGTALYAQTTAARPPAETLASLAGDISSGRVVVIDLTQMLSAATPIIQLPPPFANTPGFKSHEISHYDAKGPGWYWNWIEVGEHVGTHFDAPCHWATGKDRACVDQIPAKDFVGPAAGVDVKAEVAGHPDLVATRDTPLGWEEQHGRSAT